MGGVVYIPLSLVIRFPLSFKTGRDACIDSPVVSAHLIGCTNMLNLVAFSRYNLDLYLYVIFQKLNLYVVGTGSESLNELVSSVRQRLSIIDEKDIIQILVRLSNLA